MDWNTLPDSVIFSAKIADDCIGKLTSLVRARDYCKFGDFLECLFSRNLSYSKFRENKILKKWQNHSCRLLIKVNHAQVANF